MREGIRAALPNTVAIGSLRFAPATTEQVAGSRRIVRYSSTCAASGVVLTDISGSMIYLSKVGLYLACHRRRVQQTENAWSRGSGPTANDVMDTLCSYSYASYGLSLASSPMQIDIAIGKVDVGIQDGEAPLKPVLLNGEAPQTPQANADTQNNLRRFPDELRKSHFCSNMKLHVEHGRYKYGTQLGVAATIVVHLIASGEG
ncbi:hypothetical protein CERSUDRAFT_126512 [Gelatoporia subvermispora B]|uniref:Uncharacterized protein n=1 Tax=Ceriporiopsis subvermispora (strain B) TaxID=914234 RepID=M2PAW4_CERS8|nr:hypothetical protein CERSUDRAFT_126512 [Gelatoporia subvermispora B]